MPGRVFFASTYPVHIAPAIPQPNRIPRRYTHKANGMFGLFKKDPVKKLEQQYSKLLEEAMALQRGGDIKGYAAKSAEAEAVMDEIVKLRDGTPKA